MDFSPELLIAIKKALPVLAVIFVVVISSIILLRIILTILLENAYKKWIKIKNSKKFFFVNKAKYIKEDEELFLKKDEIPRSNSEMKAEIRARKAQENIQEQESLSGTYEIIPSKEQELDKKELNDVNIVDIVKPIGFWTSMILGQKLTYLIKSAQAINKRGDKGFWASMIEAKEREAGRQHSRGR